MTWLTKLSLRQKLLLTSVFPTLVVLVFVFASSSVINRTTYRDILESHLNGTAQILGANSASALRVNDQLSGIRLLQTATNNEDVDYTAIYDQQGQLFSEFRRPGSHFQGPTHAPRSQGTYFEADGVHVYFPIQMDGTRLGMLYLHATQKNYHRRVRDDNLIFFGVLIVCGLIAWLLAFRIRNLMYKPISQLATAAHTISQTDDYSLRVVKQGDDELGELVDQFNRMVQRIQEQNAALKKEILVRHATEQQLTAANEELMFEIGQRQQVEEQLGVLLEDLEKKNTELNDFAYVVSHDLKAPLRGISSLASWLIKDYGPVLDEKGIKYLDQLKTRTRRMHTLIEGILQYARLGQVPIDKQLVDSQRVVIQVVESLHPDEGIEIHIPDPLPMIYYDKILLHQVFQNLIGNAIQHMGNPNGSITVSCTHNEKFWQFSVADNGVGIAERHHDRIFRIFQSLHQREGSESSGIGLTLVKRIVERNRGRIRVQSKEGQGTTFLFTVPFQPVGEVGMHGVSICILDSNEDYAKHTAKLLDNLGVNVHTMVSWINGKDTLNDRGMVPEIFLVDHTNLTEDIDMALQDINTQFPSAHIIACVPERKSSNSKLRSDLRFSGVIAKPFTIDKLNSILNMSFLDA